ncbi:hypothetical protein [Paraburkholderia lacunae]|uniref:Uncharacterized protein n=1 Tax=Paraburkholderia lacunae TaxID=2211104 RepID=A0A370NCZ4_9BURK|nr:hypothetical protein [Paraburkholderia lacunae]RDK03490.1 hypothetical protein DLM46_08190 [Paraburkholderia lacunae]
MKDAFERRALLLHLGEVLEAVNWLLKCDGEKTVHELAAANASFARLALLTQVSRRMTSKEFVQRATSAFFAWPGELLEPELNRERLASTVQRNLFAGNTQGWRAYVAALSGEVPWFGVGLPSLKAGADVQVEVDSPEAAAGREQLNEEEAAGDVERNGGRTEDPRESVESSERIYPSWPWKSGV